jgi:hypothetical protein
MAPEPTSTGRCGLKLQLMWQRVEARHIPYLDLKLVCGVPGLSLQDARYKPYDMRIIFYVYMVFNLCIRVSIVSACRVIEYRLHVFTPSTCE